MGLVTFVRWKKKQRWDEGSCWGSTKSRKPSPLLVGSPRHVVHLWVCTACRAAQPVGEEVEGQRSWDRSLPRRDGVAGAGPGGLSRVRGEGPPARSQAGEAVRGG